MSTLENEILGEKQDYYCSSSSDEENVTGTAVPGSVKRSFKGSAINTGPKGVIEDLRQYKQLKAESELQNEKQLLNYAKRLNLEDSSGQDDGSQLVDFDSEESEFAKAYYLKRMSEMLAKTNTKKVLFGTVADLDTADAYLRLADTESLLYTCVIHIYEEDLPGCDVVDECLACLCKEYSSVKFCRVKASVLGTTKRFMRNALPTIQAFRDNQLIGNFVRITDNLGEDFYADTLAVFLKEYASFYAEMLIC